MQDCKHTILSWVLLPSLTVKRERRTELSEWRVGVASSSVNKVVNQWNKKLFSRGYILKHNKHGHTCVNSAKAQASSCCCLPFCYARVCCSASPWHIDLQLFINPWLTKGRRVRLQQPCNVVTMLLFFIDSDLTPSGWWLHIHCPKVDTQKHPEHTKIQRKNKKIQADDRVSADKQTATHF